MKCCIKTSLLKLLFMKSDKNGKVIKVLRNSALLLLFKTGLPLWKDRRSYELRFLIDTQKGVKLTANGAQETETADTSRTSA